MKELEKIDIVILGAGIAGLGAAQKAMELNQEAVVFEKNNSAGGLLDNFSVDGFRFDNAVHLSFATEPQVREVFDQVPYYTHPSDALNFETDKWLKHPVQNNLSPLKENEKVELIESFLARPNSNKIENYEQWLRHQYGDAIAVRYPMRYTKKYWQCEAHELSTTWIGNRMRRAELREILFGTYTTDTPNTYYTKEMRYPKKGGYKAFIKPLIKIADVRLNHEVVSIDLERKRVLFANGNIVKYKKLVNTLPLPVVIELCGETVPRNIISCSNQLEATSIDLISVGFNKKIIKDLWFYIYDEDIYASRAYSPSVKSPDNAPDGCSSLQFEFYNPCGQHNFSKQELVDNVLYALGKMNIATKEDILFAHHKYLPWGNVVFKHGMEENKKMVHEYLKLNNVECAGRFGMWDYFWSNQAMLSGHMAIDRIVSGKI